MQKLKFTKDEKICTPSKVLPLLEQFFLLSAAMVILQENGWAYFIEMLPASQFLQDVISDEFGIYPIFGFGVFRRSLDNISVLGSRNQPNNGTKTSRMAVVFFIFMENKMSPKMLKSLLVLTINPLLFLFRVPKVRVYPKFWSSRMHHH